MNGECNVTSAEILALIEGELTQSEAKQLRLHISTCKKCKTEYSSLRETRELCKYALKFSASFWPKLHERLDGIDQERSFNLARSRQWTAIRAFPQKVGEKIVERLKILKLYPAFMREVQRSDKKLRCLSRFDPKARKEVADRELDTLEKAKNADYYFLKGVCLIYCFTTKHDTPLQFLTRSSLLPYEAYQ